MAGLTLESSKALVAAAEAEATRIGVPMNVAVVDAGNNLTAFVRQDGAWLGSIDIAQGKAYTARAFDMSTKNLDAEARPDGSLFGITSSNEGHIVAFPGGIPILEGDEVVGAIGVSGGTVDQDQQVAEAGAAAHGA